MYSGVTGQYCRALATSIRFAAAAARKQRQQQGSCASAPGNPATRILHKYCAEVLDTLAKNCP
jgi:hypothetical protein